MLLLNSAALPFSIPMSGTIRRFWAATWWPKCMTTWKEKTFAWSRPATRARMGSEAVCAGARRCEDHDRIRPMADGPGAGCSNPWCAAREGGTVGRTFCGCPHRLDQVIRHHIRLETMENERPKGHAHGAASARRLAIRELQADHDASV